MLAYACKPHGLIVQLFSHRHSCNLLLVELAVATPWVWCGCTVVMVLHHAEWLHARWLLLLCSVPLRLHIQLLFFCAAATQLLSVCTIVLAC